MNIAIIGAGAAGLLSACMIDSKHEVIVYEKNEIAGKKLLLTGNGRCNLTNLVAPDIFLKSVSKNADFLKDTLACFSSQDTVDFFKNLGVPIKIEDSNRIFPVSNKAIEIRDILLKSAINKGVQFLFSTNIIEINKINDKFLIVSNTNHRYFDIVVIATGGLSYSKTGSNGDGYKFAKNFFHKVVEPRACLCGLVFDQKTNFQGTSIDCEIEILDSTDNIMVTKQKGSLMFTKNGVSGPVIFKSSSLFKGQTISNHYLKINFVPHLKKEDFVYQMKKSAADKPFYLFRKYLPANIANWLINIFNLPKNKSLEKMHLDEKEKLFKALSSALVKIKDFENIETAIITRGGVDILDIDKKTMQSKLVKGLYFIGEVLDIDGLSGGFNLQIAFSTAAACAKALQH
ncbi:MAG: aminoacetone oxidase family FAD-binding enzyme [Firmicutes bacterium]|nr:aminoacetone oxidase family FAD-binding enzyme [Bacillota bacterium]